MDKLRNILAWLITIVVMGITLWLTHLGALWLAEGTGYIPIITEVMFFFIAAGAIAAILLLIMVLVLIAMGIYEYIHRLLREFM